jgi:hypothetical protein
VLRQKLFSLLYGFGDKAFPKLLICSLVMAAAGGHALFPERESAQDSFSGESMLRNRRIGAEGGVLTKPGAYIEVFSFI